MLLEISVGSLGKKYRTDFKYSDMKGLIKVIKQLTNIEALIM